MQKEPLGANGYLRLNETRGIQAVTGRSDRTRLVSSQQAQ
jgi:hypothetical protein